jgi:hypothetical protein
VEPDSVLNKMVAAFAGSAEVETRDRQSLDIEKLNVGDWVLSRCETTGEQAYRRITKKVEHGIESMGAPKFPLYTIHYAADGGGANGLYATAEQPFWINGVGWVKACELQPGQMLEICDHLGTDNFNRPVGQKSSDVVLSGQRWQAQVISASQNLTSGVVYNIEVEEFHTYFVGTHGVWVRSSKN